MSNGRFPPPHAKKKQDGLQQAKSDLRLLKTTLQVGQHVSSHNPEKAVQQLVMAGLKMAADTNPFYTPTANPLVLLEALKKLGIGALAWTPETLMAAIDQKFGGWSKAQADDALEHFHHTGTLKTNVPQLVREKLYAIRVISTSNSAQTEWHIFEKIGGVFNDRVAQFGTVEPLSAAECARTVALIEEMRPDTYENEVKIYIAASCHVDGLYTAAPVKWLAMAEPYLQQMNFETTGEHVDPQVKDAIGAEFAKYKANKGTLREVEEELVPVQATKLLAIDEYAEEVLRIA